MNVTRTTVVHHCCDGWAGENCDIPMCSEPCVNGGVCNGPNICDCTGTGYTGPTCSLGQFHIIMIIFDIQIKHIHVYIMAD